MILVILSNLMWQIDELKEGKRDDNDRKDKHVGHQIVQNKVEVLTCDTSVFVVFEQLNDFNPSSGNPKIHS